MAYRIYGWLGGMVTQLLELACKRISQEMGAEVELEEEPGWRSDVCSVDTG